MKGVAARHKADNATPAQVALAWILTQAPDAVYLDSTGLSIDEVTESILKLIRSRVTNGRAHD